MFPWSDWFKWVMLCFSCANLLRSENVVFSNLKSKSFTTAKNIISWCGNFVERNNFRIISGESPETTQKLFLSSKFPHQEIRWNYGIFCSAQIRKFFYIILFVNWNIFENLWMVLKILYRNFCSLANLI